MKLIISFRTSACFMSFLANSHRSLSLFDTQINDHGGPTAFAEKLTGKDVAPAS